MEHSRRDRRVLVDHTTLDDAGVFALGRGEVLVQTVDFFTPVVDDPHAYGRIAAANALSDVYAMGGRPLTAMAIAAFPREGLDADDIRAIFQGGFGKLREAGVALLGGHTVQDPEIKFGYSVTGAVDPERVIPNAGAKPDDVLFLTKPIGTGLIATALKFDRLAAAAADPAIQSMRTLNRAAAETVQSLSAGAVHACTDITGFGLIGHASEMARASGVTIELDARSVPVFPGVLALAAGNKSGGLTSNMDYFGDSTQFDPGVGSELETVLFDPQTSGGLLIAVSPASADLLASRLEAAGVRAARVGTAVTRIAGADVHVRA
jgi:selenide,water dikinase